MCFICFHCNLRKEESYHVFRFVAILYRKSCPVHIFNNKLLIGISPVDFHLKSSVIDCCYFIHDMAV